MRIIKDFALLIFILFVVAGLIILYQLEKSNFEIKTNTTAVITQIQSLNRLETSQYTIEKIIDVGTTGNGIQQFLFGDRILLIAHGEVIAGIDLSKISGKDIQIDHQTVKLTLPPPQILVTTIDNNKTSVYNRQTGILTKGNVNLESKARQLAQNDIQKAACDENILGNASDNAKKQLSTILKGLGFITVIISIPAGKC